MDEPSEGLAPTIVDTLIEVVHQLVAEGVAVLVVEQNLRAATHMADRQLVMVSGRIEAETTAAELIASPELQQRYLGVEGASTHSPSTRHGDVMTSHINIALVGSKFMGRAHSNAWLNVGKFFAVDPLPTMHTVVARNDGELRRVRRAVGLATPHDRLACGGHVR